ncbi:hypothetical protein D4S03_09125 [bacterium]|nr:MAG: hypothetical protein D4S03_09125 [bacterium]
MIIMFVCALDMRPTSLRMVLVVKDTVLKLLEGQYFGRPVEPARVLSLLYTWEDYYREPPEFLVACRQDSWPAELEEALRAAGYRLEWIDSDCFQRVVNAWKSTQPDPRWLRGCLMSYLSGPSIPCFHENKIPRVIMLEWFYATLRFRMMELEGELYAEGRALCPDHVSPGCPLCEGMQEERSFESLPDRVYEAEGVYEYG